MISNTEMIDAEFRIKSWRNIDARFLSPRATSAAVTARVALGMLSAMASIY